jgi:hypothetical protein
MARSATDKKAGAVPGPFRALLWWPGAAFVLVMLAPDSIAWSIPAAGLVFVAFGFLSPIVKCRLQAVAMGAAVGAAAVPATAGADVEPATMEIEMPTIEIPKVDHRAA